MTTTVSPKALELVQSLVRINTVSRNSNLALIHLVRDALQKIGVKSRLTYNGDKTKANLFATLGEGKPAGIILSGHTDTVPWDGQDWTVDLSGGLVQNGKLYARGSADMHRRRADQYGARHCPQGRVPLPLLCARQRGPFVAHAAVG